jgi:hypothetical protein
VLGSEALPMSWKDRWGWLIPRAPERRMYRRSIVPMLLWLFGLPLALSYADEITSAPLRGLLVLLPLIFYLWVFRLYFFYLRECDELERRIELEAVAIAAMLTLSFLMSALLLFFAKVLPSTFSVSDVLVAAILLLTLSYFFVRYYLLWKNW